MEPQLKILHDWVSNEIYGEEAHLNSLDYTEAMNKVFALINDVGTRDLSTSLHAALPPLPRGLKWRIWKDRIELWDPKEPEHVIHRLVKTEEGYKIDGPFTGLPILPDDYLVGAKALDVHFRNEKNVDGRTE